MSGPVLDTALSPDSEAFRANAAHNRALADQLRADVAADGGHGLQIDVGQRGERRQRRHVAQMRRSQLAELGINGNEGGLAATAINYDEEAQKIRDELPALPPLEMNDIMDSQKDRSSLQWLLRQS